METFIDDKSITSVPDPYYGGDKGFDLVLDLLDGACDRLIEFITSY